MRGTPAIVASVSLAVVAGSWLAFVAPGWLLGPAPRGSCATFLMTRGDAVLVGHNLDDAVNETPGMLVVNKRGIAKESISYADINPTWGKPTDVRRISWTSRYGSLTYNVFGREFPDGGLNEAGLYVGEMTLMGSEYPTDPHLVRMYHNAWMQYLLDSFATVPEALESLTRVTLDGHCQWHFFVADRAGRSAVVEFAEGKALTYTGETLPVRVSTNYTYPSCLEVLARYEGFGGTSPVDFTETKKDRRFVWAASMLAKAEAGSGEATADEAFRILERMWCNANRWALVLDLKAGRVNFTTEKCRTPRFVDLASLDLTCATPVTALDINRDLEGDVAAHFEILTDARNLAVVESYFSNLDVGFLGNLFWKGRMPKRLHAQQRRFTCPAAAPAAP